MDEINIIKQAQDRFERDKKHWSDIYQAAREDLNFLSDDEYAQWDPEDAQARAQSGRPVLTIDQLGQFVHQVANDIRINTPTINVIPGGLNSDQETAEVFKGLIKNIEYESNADDAYDTGSLNAVKSSIGFIRVDHDYVDEISFDQKLCIKRVVNPLSAYLDCESVEVDGRDAMHGTVIERITVAEFKDRFPEKAVKSFEGGDENKDIDNDTDMVSVAEHYVIVEEEKTIIVTQDDEVMEDDERDDYKNKRTVKKRKVKRYTLSGAEVLEETTFPGIYIPLIPVYGEECWIDGKRKLLSLIRKSKQAQQMFNYWKSLETELLQKQPRANYIAAEGQVEDYYDDWTDPSKSAVQRYKTKDTDGNPVPPPQRQSPPTIPTGITTAARQTVDDIKATMGIYNAALGQNSNEVSGVAINQRKIESDVATFHFGDNLVKSITQVGRVLVNAIPEIYDNKRIVGIIGDEEEPKEIGVNGMRAKDQERDYDLKKGKYDVKVVTGASFTTRRQEAAKFFSDLVTRQPDLMQVMGDLMFKYSDFTGADAMAERMKKVIDPRFLDDEEQDQEKMQLQKALEESQAQIQMLSDQLKDKTLSEKAKYRLETQKMQAEAEQSRIEAELKQQELNIDKMELELKYAEFMQKVKEQQESLSPTEIDPSGSIQ